MSFSLTSEFKPTGDQPKAIKSILDSFNTNQNHVTLQVSNSQAVNMFSDGYKDSQNFYCKN